MKSTTRCLITLLTGYIALVCLAVFVIYAFVGCDPQCGTQGQPACVEKIQCGTGLYPCTGTFDPSNLVRP